MKRVLIVDPIHLKGQQLLQDAGFELQFPADRSEAGIVASLDGIDAIIVRTSRITNTIIDKAANLEIIGRHGAGVDTIDVGAATERGVTVVNTPDSNTLAVSEYVLGTILMFAKGFMECDSKVKAGNWSFRETYRPLEISGRTLGIVGYGRIGREVGAKAAALGMDVIVYDPFIDSSVSDNIQVTFATSLEELLRQADFVTLHLALSDATRGLINLEKIKLMKPSAFLVNAARGAVVVEKDLCEALSHNVIAGAATDVFEKEPPDQTNPLFKLDNIILTPHNAALTEGAMVRAATTVAQELITYFRGDRPRYLVNPSVLVKKENK